MKDFTIKIGIKASQEQQALIAYAFLRTAGITLGEFIQQAKDLTVFNGVLSSNHNTLAVECTTYESLDASEAKSQMMRLVLLQLGVAGISIGEFDSAVRNNFEDAKKK